jgi:adenine-specific DNA methylase
LFSLSGALYSDADSSGERAIPMSSPLVQSERKALGAFYTHEDVVRFLVGWGLEKGARSVIDPSCGDGRFLEAAAAAADLRLVGCDVSPQALAETAARLAVRGLTAELLGRDFFTVDPGSVEPVDLVVGNPPFIRYQRFDDRSRRAALASALRLGVRLSRLTSTWAPFVLHSTRFLRPGGRLAMVVPAEITQTHYGLRTLEGLLGRFGSVDLIAFEENFFDGAQAETCLLLADGCGGSCTSVRLTPLSSIYDLEQRDRIAEALADPVRVELADGDRMRFAEAYLDPAERRAWTSARRHRAVRTAAALAEVTNGYVTGDNEFFHRSRTAAEGAGYPPTWLYATVRSSRSLLGLRFTAGDVAAREAEGVAHHLLVPQEDLFTDREPLDRLIAEGERRGTPDRFKCRQRAPWWRVPGLQDAEVLVGYMAGATPRAAINEARAFYTNSLHGLRVRSGADPVLLALGFYSSLTLLSLEIEGRSYGGGILKIEPRELDRALLPCSDLPRETIATLARDVDRLLRAGQYEAASAAVDAALLIDGLGFAEKTVASLRAGRAHLMKRRLERSRKRT